MCTILKCTAQRVFTGGYTCVTTKQVKTEHFQQRSLLRATSQPAAPLSMTVILTSVITGLFLWGKGEQVLRLALLESWGASKFFGQ